jgi:hypothetical protein
MIGNPADVLIFSAARKNFVSNDEKGRCDRLAHGLVQTFAIWTRIAKL